jgi:hypothetical protein
MGDPVQWTQLKAIASVRNTIGDPLGAATERWTQAEIADYLDRAGQTVILDTQHILRTVWDFDMVADTQEYVMANNFLEATSVKWWKADDESDQRELSYMTFRRWSDWYPRDPVASGAPTHYTLWNKLGDDITTVQPPIMMIRPVPSSTGEGATDKIRVYGVKVPDVMASPYANIMELKGHHVEAQVIYAAHLAQLDDGEMTAAQILEQKYERLISKIKNDEARQDRSDRPRIRPRASRLWLSSRNRNAPIPQWIPRVY